MRVVSRAPPDPYLQQISFRKRIREHTDLTTEISVKVPRNLNLKEANGTARCTGTIAQSDPSRLRFLRVGIGARPGGGEGTGRATGRSIKGAPTRPDKHNARSDPKIRGAPD
jgi:hypothetical protein